MQSAVSTAPLGALPPRVLDGSVPPPLSSGNAAAPGAAANASPLAFAGLLARREFVAALCAVLARFPTFESRLQLTYTVLQAACCECMGGPVAGRLLEAALPVPAPPPGFEAPRFAPGAFLVAPPKPLVGEPSKIPFAWRILLPLATDLQARHAPKDAAAATPAAHGDPPAALGVPPALEAGVEGEGASASTRSAEAKDVADFAAWARGLFLTVAPPAELLGVGERLGAALSAACGACSSANEPAALLKGVTEVLVRAKGRVCEWEQLYDGFAAPQWAPGAEASGDEAAAPYRFPGLPPGSLSAAGGEGEHLHASAPTVGVLSPPPEAEEGLAAPSSALWGFPLHAAAASSLAAAAPPPPSSSPPSSSLCGFVQLSRVAELGCVDTRGYGDRKFVLRPLECERAVRRLLHYSAEVAGAGRPLLATAAFLLAQPDLRGDALVVGASGDSLLHVAARGAPPELVLHMLERGAPRLVLNRAELSPYQLAVRRFRAAAAVDPHGGAQDSSESSNTKPRLGSKQQRRDASNGVALLDPATCAHVFTAPTGAAGKRVTGEGTVVKCVRACSRGEWEAAMARAKAGEFKVWMLERGKTNGAWILYVSWNKQQGTK